MKRFFSLLIIFGIFVGLVWGFTRPVILFVAKMQFKKAFPMATVAIKDCRLNPLHRLSFFGLEIRQGKIGSLQIKEANVQYDLGELIKGRIYKVSLVDVDLNVDLPRFAESPASAGQNVFKVFQGSPQTTSAKLSLGALEILRLKVKGQFQGITFAARISASMDVGQQRIDSIDGQLDSLAGENYSVKNASLRSGQQQPGEFSVEEFQVAKLKGVNIKAAARLAGKNLFLDSLSGEVLGGKVTGDCRLQVEPPSSYVADLKFQGLDTKQVVEDFDLKEKFQMSGRFDGKLTLKGQGTDVDILAGDFSASENGGTLVIQDTRMLENVAKSTNQPLELVVASLKNYHYNVGIMKLSLDKGNLNLDMSLGGETGKRNINITLHDVSLTKEGL